MYVCTYEGMEEEIRTRLDDRIAGKTAIRVSRSSHSFFFEKQILLLYHVLVLVL